MSTNAIALARVVAESMTKTNASRNATIRFLNSVSLLLCLCLCKSLRLRRASGATHAGRAGPRAHLPNDVSARTSVDQWLARGGSLKHHITVRQQFDERA